MFFTRLPLWKMGVEVDGSYFERIVPLWPLAGWLTGGVMALVGWSALGLGLSAAVAVVLALSARVLLTGGLHEDGWADFCDGFGGGRTRGQTLDIMKDSHIGTYGTLGLILYYALLVSLLTMLLDRDLSVWLLVAGDAFSKMTASTIIWFLPYVRSQEEAKNRLTYSRVPMGEKFLTLLLGLLPLLLFCVKTNNWLLLGIATGVQALAATGLFVLMHKRIGGYTGDCCGATFILLETLFYLVCLV